MAAREFCPHCYHDLWGGTRCKRRSCPSYAPIYLRDQAERINSNLPVWDGKTCMVTLTAPGSDELPWDRRYAHLGKHKCSGRLGCRVDESAAAVWNADAAKRLSALVNHCQQRVRDVHGKHGRVFVLCYVLEAQRRGELHPHLVLGYKTAADRAALDTFLKAMRRLRGRYGFGTGRDGFHGGRPDHFSPADAARYISKYLRPDGAKTSFVPLLSALERWIPYRRDPETGEVVMSSSPASSSKPRRPARLLLRPVYVNPKLTAISGVTMGFLRYRRWSWRKYGDLPHDQVLAAYQEWKARPRDEVPWDVRHAIEEHFRSGWQASEDDPPALQAVNTQDAWPF